MALLSSQEILSNQAQSQKNLSSSDYYYEDMGSSAGITPTEGANETSEGILSELDWKERVITARYLLCNLTYYEPEHEGRQF